MNKYANMEIIGLEDITEIYSSIGTELMNLENEKDYVAVYGKRDLINELFEMMIADGYSFRYADCDFIDEMLKDTVYMMFVYSDCGVSIEPAHCSKGTPTMHDAKTAFIFMDDCKQDVIDYCVKSDKNVVLFDYEDDCCGCDECQCVCNDNDGELTTLSTYFVNGEPVDKSVFEKYDKELRARMKAIEDEMNAFRRLFW